MKLNLVLAFATLILTLIGISYATETVGCSTCNTTDGCSGTVMAKETLAPHNTLPYPDGCHESWWPFNESCAGTCHVCTGSTATNWCQYNPNGDTCHLRAGYSLDCGDTMIYNCTGNAFPDCACDGGEGEEETDPDEQVCDSVDECTSGEPE